MLLKNKKFLCSAIALSIAFSTLLGCTNKIDNKNAADANTTTAQTQKEAGKIGPATLKVWVPMHASAVKIMKSYNDNEMYKELEKRTDVHIEFIHPATGQEKEQFNLMVASKDLPDIISQYASSYPGGAEQAIADGIYLKLNDLVDKHAPNYKQLRDSNKDIARQTVTNNGSLWAFFCIQPDLEPAWSGPIIRKDWLDELQLKVPETIDDWYTTLKAFKDKKGATAPLIFPKSGYDTRGGVFTGAYDTAPAFIKKGSTIKYGFIEPGFKDYLAAMNKWYSEGLIDKDFATRNSTSSESIITTGKAGAWISTSNSIAIHYETFNKTDPKANLATAPYPVLKAGDKVQFRQKDDYNKGYETVVTSACKTPEIAVKWLDYAYGKDGFMLFNYGIENVSYTMVNGKPQFTELMTNNPEGITYPVLAWKYKLHVGPYWKDWKAYPDLEKEQPLKEVWNKAGTDYIMPPVALTTEENQKYSGIMSEVNTYKDEMILKFIMGVEPMSKYDEYVSRIKKMNIDEAVKIQQAAYDRYLKR